MTKLSGPSFPPPKRTASHPRRCRQKEWASRSALTGDMKSGSGSRTPPPWSGWPTSTRSPWITWWAGLRKGASILNIMGEIAVVFGVCLISEGISFLLALPLSRRGHQSGASPAAPLFWSGKGAAHWPGLRLPGGQYGLLLGPALCSHHGALGEASSLPGSPSFLLP